MNARFVIAIGVVAATISVLMYSAVGTTAKAVVTVQELLHEGASRQRIRLGARVAGDQIRFHSKPAYEVHFAVRDISGPESMSVPVVYQGTMPDTLKAGRDVILEGDYDGRQFVASSLMTQCPSKYEPPVPGANKGAK